MYGEVFHCMRWQWFIVLFMFCLYYKRTSGKYSVCIENIYEMLVPLFALNFSPRRRIYCLGVCTSAPANIRHSILMENVIFFTFAYYTSKCAVVVKALWVGEYLFSCHDSYMRRILDRNINIHTRTHTLK